ncbi:MAG: hypothetical protein FJY83_03900 [Candidatus Aminicenantes bacterium]|nr:hypothetical protein [Candidatus Aminicenantes bacterium]
MTRIQPPRRGILVSAALTACFLCAFSPGNAGDALPGGQAETPSAPRFFFESGINPALDSLLSSGGSILVKPRINDQEVGWFLLDPGVEGMRIHASLAEALELAASGTHRLIATSKSEERRTWLCSAFQLGPCRAERLELTEMTSNPEEETGEPVLGVVGTALLRSVVAEIEPGTGAVRLYDPSIYADRPADWREFRLANSLPVVNCRFEGDREGEFGLDLRSPLGVVFFRPAVEALGFLRNKVTRPGTISGQNFGKASVRTGVLEWFETAGFRREKVRAVFLTEDVLAASTAGLTGLLGRDALGKGVLVLDYQRQRLAVMPGEAE